MKTDRQTASAKKSAKPRVTRATRATPQEEKPKAGKKPSQKQNANDAHIARVTAARVAFDTAHAALNTLFEICGSDDPTAANYARSAIFRLLSNGGNRWEMIIETAVAVSSIEWVERKADGSLVQHGPNEERPQLQFLRELLSKEEALPGLHYAHPDKQKQVQGVVDDLKLGEGVGLHFGGKDKGKRYSLDNLANQVAERIFRFADPFRGRANIDFGLPHWDGQKLTPEQQEGVQKWVREFAVKLPPLSRKEEVVKAWARAGAKFLPLVYGREFQAHPSLAPLAKATEKNKKGKPARWALRKNVENAIKKAWVRIGKVGEE